MIDQDKFWASIHTKKYGQAWVYGIQNANAEQSALWKTTALNGAKERLAQLIRRLVFEGQDDVTLQSVRQVLEGFDAEQTQILEAHRQAEQQKAEAALTRFLAHPQLQVLEIQLRRELISQFLIREDM